MTLDELVLTIKRAEHTPLSREADARISARLAEELSPERKVLGIAAIAVACAIIFFSMQSLSRATSSAAADGGGVGPDAAGGPLIVITSDASVGQPTPAKKVF